MKNYVYPILLLAVFSILGGTALWRNQTHPPVPVTTEVATVATTDVPRTPASSTPSKPVPPSGTPAPGPTKITATQVTTHNSAESCWTSISGNVYDLTAWISQHPGGRSAILSLCGVDGTAAFNAQHGGQGRPEHELATFKVGSLAN